MAKHPSQLAEFEIRRCLGAGGMAEVFLASCSSSSNPMQQIQSEFGAEEVR